MFLGINFKSFVSLKTGYLVGFILFWNAGFFLAMQMGGGGLEGGLSDVGMLITGVICFASSIFAFAVASLPQLQIKLIDPERKADFTKREFYILALILWLIGITRFTFPAFT